MTKFGRLSASLALFLICGTQVLAGVLNDTSANAQGDCNTIIQQVSSKGDVNIDVVCGDPKAAEAIVILSKKVDSISDNSEEYNSIIIKKIKNIEKLVREKSRTNETREIDKAIEGYAKGNNELLKQLLAKLSETEYDKLFGEDDEFEMWPEIKKERKFKVHAFTTNTSCDEDEVNIAIVKIRIVGRDVSMKVGNQKFDARLSEDRKTIFAQATIRDGNEIETTRGEARIRKDNTLDGEFHWVWQDGSHRCTGTDILTRISS